MFPCAYCEAPLTCDACGAEWRPADEAQHRALSAVEVPLPCNACGQPLVCRWCKTPYDGIVPEDEPGAG